MAFPRSSRFSVTRATGNTRKRKPRKVKPRGPKANATKRTPSTRTLAARTVNDNRREGLTKGNKRSTY